MAKKTDLQAREEMLARANISFEIKTIENQLKQIHYHELFLIEFFSENGSLEGMAATSDEADTRPTTAHLILANQ